MVNDNLSGFDGGKKSYAFGIFAIGFLVVLIAVTGITFAILLPEPEKKPDFADMLPIEMDIITVQEGTRRYSTIQPYLSLRKGADVGFVCLNLPRVQDSIVRELRVNPPGRAWGSIDLEAVRRAMKLSLAKVMRDDNPVTDVHVKSSMASTLPKPPMRVVKCGEKRTCRISKH